MRGDLALDARLALRADGIVGLLAAIAGVAALMSAYLPWYEVTATVDALGRSDRGPAASLAGWEAQPWGWVVPAAAIAAVVIGLSWAVDRPVPHAEQALLGVGVVLSATVTAGGLVFPTVDRFASSRLHDMLALADRLPTDVALAFEVHPAGGLWLCLGAAVVVVLAGTVVRVLWR